MGRYIIMRMKLNIALVLMTAFIALLLALPRLVGAQESLLTHGKDLAMTKPDNYPIATLAGGCFWCMESEIRAVDGVLFTRVGYMGGTTENVTYEQVTTGKTGHAEVVEVTFDPAKITYKKLIALFLTKWHDPTQLNRQGVDVGTQYRSAIFTHDETQKTEAASVIAALTTEKKFSKPIVTTIEPAATFWTGEDYHQQYYEKYRDKTGQDHIRVILKKAGKLKD